jgi:hypothetical protein
MVEGRLSSRAARLSDRLPQHPDQHRSERPISLAVDQELGEGPGLGVRPVRADPVDPLEVGDHQDVEQLGAGSNLMRTSDC